MNNKQNVKHLQNHPLGIQQRYSENFSTGRSLLGNLILMRCTVIFLLMTSTSSNHSLKKNFQLKVWYICLKAYQLLMSYFILKFDSFVNKNDISKVPLHFFLNCKLRSSKFNIYM